MGAGVAICGHLRAKNENALTDAANIGQSGKES